MSKFSIPILFTAILASAYHVAAGITIGDFIFLFLALLCLFNCIQKKWEIHSWAWLSLGYTAIQFLSAFFNNCLSETVFINFARNFFQGIVAFTIVFNVISLDLSRSATKRLLLSALAYAVWFFIFSRSALEVRFDSGFYGRDENGVLFNLNNWGFLGLLQIFIFFSILRFTKEFRILTVIGILIASFAVVMSFSRAAYALAAASALFLVLIEKNRLKNLALLGVAFVGASFLATYLFPDAFSFGKDFFANKQDVAGSDLKETRIVALNVVPIQTWLSSLTSPAQLFMGMGDFIAHSFVAQIFVSTGLIGGIYFLGYHTKILYTAFISFPKRYWLLGLLVLVMLANDFVTNMRFIKTDTSCLYMVALGLILAFREREARGVRSPKFSRFQPRPFPPQ